MPSAPGIACVTDRCSTQTAPLFTARRSGHCRRRMCLRNGRLAARDDRARNGGQERKAGDNDGGIVAISVGLRTLLEIAQDETAPKGVCADCAKALLDRDGYVAPRAEAAEPG